MRAQVLVTSLDAYSGYEFRLIAQRGARSSLPSQPTELLLPGPAGERLLEAPVAESTSSASYRLSWAGNAGPCRPELLWDLLVMKPSPAAMAGVPAVSGVDAVAGAGASGDVRLLASSLRNTSSHEEFGIRCPPPGCAFRLHATNVRSATAGQVWRPIASD